MSAPVLTIDVAHPPRHPDDVESELSEALSRVLRSQSFRLLKIVHGYGSSGKGGGTKETVLNWAYRQRGRVRGIITGETYGMFDEMTRRMRQETGQFPDPDLDASNRGVTLVWVK